MEAELIWQLNSALYFGPWPVRVSADAAGGRLLDLATLEDLRETHNFGPMFTLRFPDGTTLDVAVGRPGDDGTFILIDGDTAAAVEAAATVDVGPDGLLPEPEQVARVTTWLEEHGFTTHEQARAGRISGSRLFARDDGWRVRYSCVFGAWSLELSSPGHHGFTKLPHLDPDALPALIGEPPPVSP